MHSPRSGRSSGHFFPLSLRVSALLMMLLVGIAGCENSTSAGPVAAELEVFSGDGQEVPFNWDSPEPLVVRAVDASGNPVRNVPVSWSAPRGTLGSPVLTDADGLASTTWHVNFAGPEQAAATAPELEPVYFAAIGRPAGDGIQDFDVDHLQVGVNNGPATLHFRALVHGEDGVGHVSVRLFNSSGPQAGATLVLVDGDAHDGIWEGTLTIPQGTPGGTWNIRAMVAPPSEAGCNCIGYPRMHYGTDWFERHQLPSAIVIVSNAS